VLRSGVQRFCLPASTKPGWAAATKDRTKTGVDRIVELCPRAIQVLNRQLALRQDYVMAGKLRHELLFFFPGGKRISDPEVTRWRWAESLQRARVRQRGPYHARHTYVSWLLMTGKNLLWVAEQNGHSVEVMLRMYAKWLKGSTEADIEAIRQAMNARHESRSASAPQAMNALGTGPNTAHSREFATRFATRLPPADDRGGKSRDKWLTEEEEEWRRGWDSNTSADP
jgi:hypothetical protein